MILFSAASFLIFGFILVLVGANQPGLAAAFHLDLAGTGLLASALSLGLGVGVAIAGPPVDRWPRRPLFVGSALLAAGALLLMGPALGPKRAALLMALIGLGAGSYETLINTAVAESDPGRAASRLSAVHACATGGAVVGAPLLGFLAERGGFALGFRTTGVALVVLCAVAFSVRFPAPPTGAGTSARAGAGPATRALLPLAAMGAVYVGFETAITAFAVPWAESLSLSREQGIGAISAFWMGLLVGRVVFALTRRPATPLLLAGAGGGAAVLLGAGLLAHVRALEVLVGGIGLLLGPVFPVLVALTVARFPERRGTATGLVVAAGSAGGVGVPWLTGVLGDGFGAVAAVGGLAAWCALLAALGLASARVRP